MSDVKTDCLGTKRWTKRHRDFECFDEVNIKLVPRYKMSGMSGDEWRVSAVIQLSFKGILVHETFYINMETAVRHLDSVMMKQSFPIPAMVRELENHKCFQPGCRNSATVTYVLEKEYSRQGEELAPRNGRPPFSYFRRFCDQHSARGDCGLEDADRNYKVLEEK